MCTDDVHAIKAGRRSLGALLGAVAMGADSLYASQLTRSKAAYAPRRDFANGQIAQIYHQGRTAEVLQLSRYLCICNIGPLEC